MINTIIKGIGSYLPEKKLTNHDLENIMTTSNEWIIERTGIESRHICSEHESAASMGVIAAKRALEDAQITAAEIGMIIVGTTTPDKLFPSTACIISHELNCAPAAAFDVTAACAGWIYALSVADKFVRSTPLNSKQKYTLVIGTEVLSRITNWEDRKTAVLFGDGAGAIVVAPGKEEGILSTHLHADGKYGDVLYAPNAIKGQRQNLDHPKIFMQGNEVFKVAVRTLAKVAQETLEANQLTHDDIDWLIPHQANLRIIQATGKRLGIPNDKVIVTVNKHGNTSSASIPLAMDEAKKDGRLKKGDLLLLESFGGGFAWGAALVRY